MAGGIDPCQRRKPPEAVAEGQRLQGSIPPVRIIRRGRWRPTCDRPVRWPLRRQNGPFAGYARILAAANNGQPRVEIRVIDRVSAPLLHGKAGVITLADGRKTCFMGSVNETRHAWQNHYELLWEDESEEGIEWTQQEFDFLWGNAVALPDA